MYTVPGVVYDLLATTISAQFPPEAIFGILS